MKIIKLILIFTLCFCINCAMYSCSKEEKTKIDDGFVVVRKVTYTDENGIQHTEKSCALSNYKDSELITYEEYQNAPASSKAGYKPSARDANTLSRVKEGHQGQTKVFVPAEEKRVEYYYVENIVCHYYKGTFEGTTYYYVYVKILDSNTITIKTSGSTRTYSGNSYTILYFNDQ